MYARSNNRCSIISIYVDTFYTFQCFVLFNYVWVQGVAGSCKRLGRAGAFLISYGVFFW